ncbi:Hypothetical protein, putative, partial [Bodo saltans]
SRGRPKFFRCDLMDATCQTKRCLHQQRNTCRRGWALGGLTSSSCDWPRVPPSKRAKKKRLAGRHLSDEALSSSAAQHLQARLGARGFDVAELRLASCATVKACLASMRRVYGTLDLIVVEVPLDSGNQSTWAPQQLLIELIGSSEFLNSKLALGGIVMINGYQPQSISAINTTPDATGPRIAKAIKEPLLAFVADFIMQQLATKTGIHHDPRWAGYTVRNEQVIDRAIDLYSDMTIDSHNSLYLRRGDARHRPRAQPHDHLK